MKREEWKNNFSKWFNDTLSEGEIMDIQYPVKGLYVWKPHGLRLRNNVMDILKGLLEEDDHDEVLFPLLIPKNLLKKEADHIKGFGDEVYWVTHGGRKKLNVDLALRPTSETSIYPVIQRWIRSHTDLPLKIYQIVNIFRHETKMTKPLIRLREVTTFKEAHTAHESLKDAEAQIQKAIELYQQFFDELGIPYNITKRPPWDTFAGADYSIAFDILAPDGRTIQIGTVHNLKQNFSKIFDLTFETPEGEQEYVYQTCYGISDRAIASLIIAHGDDQGLCLPPKVAPVQVAIVPIPYKESEVDVYGFAKEVKKELEGEGVRVELDTRDLRPGDKYFRWERRGVPLRIEIGPNEVKDEKLTFVRRDTGGKTEIDREVLTTETGKLFERIQGDLRSRASDFQEDQTIWVEELEEAEKILDNREGIVKISWCGKKECGLKLEEKTGGSVLGRELNAEKTPGNCPVCKEDTDEYVLISKTY